MNEADEPHAGTEAAPLWLDEWGEWQVEGVVRHRTGTLRLRNGRLALSLTTTTGRFRKGVKTVHISHAVSEIEAVTVIHSPTRLPSLELRFRGAVGPLTLHDCRPDSTLTQLLTELGAANVRHRNDG